MESGAWLDFDWPEADLLFQRDQYWVGGDGAYSVDLGEGRVLWLFGDSWIDPRGMGSREGATMVSNSLALQNGYDPSQATAEFYWGQRRTVRRRRSSPTSMADAIGRGTDSGSGIAFSCFS